MIIKRTSTSWTVTSIQRMCETPISRSQWLYGSRMQWKRLNGKSGTHSKFFLQLHAPNHHSSKMVARSVHHYAYFHVFIKKVLWKINMKSLNYFLPLNHSLHVLHYVKNRMVSFNRFNILHIQQMDHRPHFICGEHFVFFIHNVYRQLESL